jgi:hypothetical protein
MKGLAAVVIACTFAVILTIALMLLSPAGAWWRNPVSLAALCGTVGLVVMVLVPRSWWRT